MNPREDQQPDRRSRHATAKIMVHLIVCMMSVTVAASMFVTAFVVEQYGWRLLMMTIGLLLLIQGNYLYKRAVGP